MIRRNLVGAEWCSKMQALGLLYNIAFSDAKLSQQEEIYFYMYKPIIHFETKLWQIKHTLYDSTKNILLERYFKYDIERIHSSSAPLTTAVLMMVKIRSIHILSRDCVVEFDLVQSCWSRHGSTMMSKPASANQIKLTEFRF
jgi:hypothetical protein